MSFLYKYGPSKTVAKNCAVWYDVESIGLTWYRVLIGCDVMGNSFADFDEAVLPEQIEIVKKCVMEVTQ